MLVLNPQLNVLVLVYYSTICRKQPKVTENYSLPFTLFIFLNMEFVTSDKIIGTECMTLFCFS